MRLSALIAFRIFLTAGFFVPAWDALSQQSSTPGLGPSPEPNRIDELVQLQHKVETNRQNAPDIVTKAIQGDPQRSVFYAGEAVRYALRGLGNSISEAEISFLIAAAVNARPQAALQIVRVAVGEVPSKFHANIVAAAVADVPDPYEQVVVVHRREGSPDAPKSIEKKSPLFLTDKVVASDGKSSASDGKSMVTEGKAVATEGKESVGPYVLGYEPSNSPDSITLAEAIIQSALEGGSTAGLDTLTDSVNAILLGLTGPLGAWNPVDLNNLITRLRLVSPAKRRRPHLRRLAPSLEISRFKALAIFPGCRSRFGKRLRRKIGVK
jgi:hypothetical protein